MDLMRVGAIGPSEKNPAFQGSGYLINTAETMISMVEVEIMQWVSWTMRANGRRYQEHYYYSYYINDIIYDNII